MMIRGAFGEWTIWANVGRNLSLPLQDLYQSTDWLLPPPYRIVKLHQPVTLTPLWESNK